MKKHSYPKVYALGHPALEGLLDGPVVVEEKLDGSQFSFARDGGDGIWAWSRSREQMEAPDKMFADAIGTVRWVAPAMRPGWIYRGEYLAKPKHNTLAYDRVPTGFIMIFDIMTGPEEYLGYSQKWAEAERLGLEVVPRFDVTVTGPEDVKRLLETTSCLGGQPIEGVVVKNYSRFGRDGHFLAGKYVSEKFKETNRTDWKERNPGGKDVIGQIVDKYRTGARWQKAVQHLQERGELEGSPKDIGPLMRECQQDIEAECGEEIREVLWQWARKDILRRCARGLPEWYKERLLEQQFEEADHG